MDIHESDNNLGDIDKNIVFEYNYLQEMNPYLFDEKEDDTIKEDIHDEKEDDTIKEEYNNNTEDTEYTEVEEYNPEEKKNPEEELNNFKEKLIKTIISNHNKIQLNKMMDIRRNDIRRNDIMRSIKKNQINT